MVYNLKRIFLICLGLSVVIVAAGNLLGPGFSLYYGPTHRSVFILLDTTAFILFMGFTLHRILMGSGWLLLNINRDRLAILLIETLDRHGLRYELKGTSEPSEYKKIALIGVRTIFHIRGTPTTGSFGLWIDHPFQIPNSAVMLADLKSVILREKATEGSVHAQGLLFLFCSLGLICLTPVIIFALIQFFRSF
ncbi:MAG: hypothetical protein ABIK28_14555 [Planctomycetota bacterium]